MTLITLIGVSISREISYLLFKHHVQHSFGAVRLQQLHNMRMLQHVTYCSFTFQVWKHKVAVYIISHNQCIWGLLLEIVQVTTRWKVPMSGHHTHCIWWAFHSIFASSRHSIMMWWVLGLNNEKTIKFVNIFMLFYKRISSSDGSKIVHNSTIMNYFE